MIKNRGQKLGCAVAGAAWLVGDDVRAGFSRRFEAVVTCCARANHFAVIHANGRFEGGSAVAAATIVGGRQVSAGFAFGGCSIVATATGANHFGVINFCLRRKAWLSRAMARFASIGCQNVFGWLSGGADAVVAIVAA